MNIVFIWIEYMRGLKNKLIIMNNNYTVTKDNFSFKVTKNNTFNSMYSNKNIIDSYLLLGKNATGKTTILDLLYNLVNSNDKSEYFILFESNGVYSVYCNGNKEELEKNLIIDIVGSSATPKIYEGISNINTCMIKVGRLFNFDNGNYDNTTDILKLDYNSYCFGYYNMNHKSYELEVVKASDKLKSLIENKFIFSKDESKVVHLILPLVYSPIVFRKDKCSHVINVQELTDLFFDNMRSIFFGINHKNLAIIRKAKFYDVMKNELLEIFDNSMNSIINKINVIDDIQEKKKILKILLRSFINP